MGTVRGWVTSTVNSDRSQILELCISAVHVRLQLPVLRQWRWVCLYSAVPGSSQLHPRARTRMGRYAIQGSKDGQRPRRVKRYPKKRHTHACRHSAPSSSQERNMVQLGVSVELHRLHGRLGRRTNPRCTPRVDCLCVELGCRGRSEAPVPYRCQECGWLIPSTVNVHPANVIEGCSRARSGGGSVRCAAEWTGHRRTCGLGCRRWRVDAGVEGDHRAKGGLDGVSRTPS